MDLDAAFRDHGPEALATLIRLLGDFDLAEEADQRRQRLRSMGAKRDVEVLVHMSPYVPLIPKAGMSGHGTWTL